MAWFRKELVEFIGDRAGNVAIMTAVALPTLMVMIFGGTTVMKALSERRQLQAIAQTACNRAVKPQRLISLSDVQRSEHAKQLFTSLAEDRHIKLTANSVTVTSSWLQAEVKAQAVVQIMPGWGPQAAIPISVSERCTGIPPYPAKGDVILSSNFKTPSGTAVDLPYTNGSASEKWGVFTGVQIGWEGHSGAGIEIQDWKNGFTLAAGKLTLPAGVASTYVVELDSGPLPGGPETAAATCGVKASGYNSSMYKTFELHPGTYRLSLWFYSRVAKSQVTPAPTTNTTNRVVVYLEGVKPVSAKAAVIVWDDYTQSWQRRSQDILVTSYGLYKLHIAAEGCSDGSGGLFNDLKLEYIKRPSPEYNDVAAN